MRASGAFQAKRPGVGFEQCDAEPFLHQVQLLAECRLGDVESFRGFTDTGAARDDDNTLKVSDADSAGVVGHIVRRVTS